MLLSIDYILLYFGIQFRSFLKRRLADQTLEFSHPKEHKISLFLPTKQERNTIPIRHLLCHRKNCLLPERFYAHKIQGRHRKRFYHEIQA